MRYTRTPITSGFETQSQINNNFADIETAINDTLSRAGDSPNFLETDIDFNGHKIYNLPAPSSSTEPLRLGDLPLLDFSAASLPALSSSTADKVLTNDGVSLGWSLAKKVVNSISDLTAIPVTQIQNGVVYGTKYHTSSAAGGQAEYEYSSTSTATVDNVTVINAAGGVGRWLLKHSGTITLAQAGCMLDGVTDDYTQLQAAINTGISIIDGEGRPCKFNSQLTLKSNQEIRNVVFDSSSQGAVKTVVATGTQSSPLSLTANLVFGTRVVSVGSTSTLAAGDYVYIGATTLWSTVDNCPIGEVNQIKSVDSATQVTLRTNAASTYNTAASASISKLDFTNAKNITFRNVSAIGSNALEGNIGFEFNQAKDIIFVDCDFSRYFSYAIAFRRCVDGYVFNSHIHDCSSNATGYGVSIQRACINVNVYSCDFNGMRHGVSIGGSEGVSRYCHIANSTFNYCTDAGADTHSAAEFCVINNNTIRCAGGQDAGTSSNDGLMIQGTNCICSGNVIYNPNNAGIVFQPFCDGAIRPASVSITGNTVYYPSTQGIYVLSQAKDCRGVTVNNNTVVGQKGSANTAIYLYAYQARLENFTVVGNTVTDSEGFGIWVRGGSTTDGNVLNCYGGVVSSNSVIQTAINTREGIRVDIAKKVNVVSNNVTMQNTASAIYGIRSVSSFNTVINNNIISYPSSSSGTAILFDGTGSNNSAGNNTVYAPSSTAVIGINVVNSQTNCNVGFNDLFDCTTKIAWGTGTGHRGGYLTGSATYDPPSLADGAGTTTTVTVTGAALGDVAAASFSLDLQGITLTAWVSASNTVSVRFQNESGGVLDLASGTLRAQVWKVN